MNIGILGAVSYEGIIEQEVSRTDVKTRFGDVSVLDGTVGDVTVYYIRRFGQDNDTRSDRLPLPADLGAQRRQSARMVPRHTVAIEVTLPLTARLAIHVHSLRK